MDSGMPTTSLTWKQTPFEDNKTKLDLREIPLFHYFIINNITNVVIKIHYKYRSRFSLNYFLQHRIVVNAFVVNAYVVNADIKLY